MFWDPWSDKQYMVKPDARVTCPRVAEKDKVDLKVVNEMSCFVEEGYVCPVDDVGPCGYVGSLGED